MIDLGGDFRFIVGVLGDVALDAVRALRRGWSLGLERARRVR